MESTGVLEEEPTGLELSVAGKEKKESRMMSKAPWMLRPHSEEGKTG